VHLKTSSEIWGPGVGGNEWSEDVATHYLLTPAGELIVWSLFGVLHPNHDHPQHSIGPVIRDNRALPVLTEPKRLL
jgi:hypothetical protein